MKISTICVSKNCKNLVDQTIKSFASQNFSNKEIIFIDSLSNDGTVNQIRNSCKKYNINEYLLLSEMDKGISDAMNKGWSLAKGDVINFLHFGDCYSSKTIFCELSILFKKKECDFFAGAANFNYGSSKEFLGIPKNISKIYYANTFAHMAVFIKNSLKKQINLYDINLKIVMDYDLWFRAYKLNKKFGYTDKIFVNLHNAGESAKINLVLIDFCKCKIKHIASTSSVFEKIKILNSFLIISLKVLTYAFKNKI